MEKSLVMVMFDAPYYRGMDKWPCKFHNFSGNEHEGKTVSFHLLFN